MKQGSALQQAVRATLLGGLIFLVACERETVGPEEEPVPLPVEEPQVEPVEEETPEELTAETEWPPEVTFSTWPGREEHRTFELMWLGGDQEVPLHEGPSPESEVVATLSWYDGENLQLRRTAVHVERPRPYRLREATRWMGIPFDVEYGELESGPQSFLLEEGEVVYLYQYEGEGSCFYGVQNEIALGDCPTAAMEAVDETGLDDVDLPWRPLKQTWWVEVEAETAQGWLLVDEAPVEVHTRSIDGFDQSGESDGRLEEL